MIESAASDLASLVCNRREDDEAYEHDFFRRDTFSVVQSQYRYLRLALVLVVGCSSDNNSGTGGVDPNEQLSALTPAQATALCDALKSDYPEKTVTCGSACAGGTLAGKFVTIAGTRQFTAIFTAYGLIGNITLHQSTIVQAQ